MARPAQVRFPRSSYTIKRRRENLQLLRQSSMMVLSLQPHTAVGTTTQERMHLNLSLKLGMQYRHLLDHPPPGGINQRNQFLSAMEELIISGLFGNLEQMLEEFLFLCIFQWMGTLKPIWRIAYEANYYPSSSCGAGLFIKTVKGQDCKGDNKKLLRYSSL